MKPYGEAKIQVPKFCEENGFYTTRQRSSNMSKIRSNKRKLPGKPDIAFIKYKLLVFVDGSFWHGHDWDNRKAQIRSNREFWVPKIERNMQRDREIQAFYQSRGWTVLRFWDFEVKKELGTCVKAVIDAYQAARAISSHS